MPKVEVRTPFSARRRFFSPSPKGTADIYQEKLLDDGTMGIEVVGQHDLNAFVQASKDSTLIYNILDRFQKTGDPSIIDRVKGFFADVTDMPKDLMQAQNLLINAEKQFASLPGVLKEKYDNNYTKFAEEVLSGKVVETLEAYFGKKAEDLGGELDVPVAE